MNKVARVFESIGETAIFSSSDREVKIKDAVLKIFLLSIEIPVAVGTYYLFTEKYIVTVLPHLTGWSLTTTCIGVNLVALFILGVSIHWAGNRARDLTKNHKWKVTVLSEDLIKACVVGCLSRALISCVNHERFSWKGISLEAAFITAMVVIGFMNIQRTGNRLYPNTEKLLPNTVSQEAMEKLQNDYEEVLAKNDERITNLEKQLQDAKIDLESVEKAKNENAGWVDKLSKDLKAREKQIEALQKELAEKPNIDPQEFEDLKKQLELERSTAADALRQKYSQELEKTLSFFEAIQTNDSDVKALLQKHKALKQKYDDLHTQFRTLIHFRLIPLQLENNELRKVKQIQQPQTNLQDASTQSKQFEEDDYQSAEEN